MENFSFFRFYVEGPIGEDFLIWCFGTSEACPITLQRFHQCSLKLFLFCSQDTVLGNNVYLLFSQYLSHPNVKGKEKILTEILAHRLTQ